MAKTAAQLVHLIEAVNSPRLAESFERRCATAGKVCPSL
jgi:hypothetical protein